MLDGVVAVRCVEAVISLVERVDVVAGVVVVVG